MKIIISRKGFDAENGGCASPIMPDGTMLSLPIPQQFDEDMYSDIWYKDKNYDDIWSRLKPKRNLNEVYCHLDPDLRKSARKNNPKEWKAVFGQCDAAETHLEKQGVCVGDIFIFFGWFKQTENVNGMIKYKKGAKDVHALFGYLQIGDIIRGKKIEQYKWHPHSRYVNQNNTLYVASDGLSIDGEDLDLPGAGIFSYSENLVLTMHGMAKSRWLLPDFFKDVNISHHSKNSFKPEGYFQSVRIGQEFVVSESDKVTQWAKELIINHVYLQDDR